MAAPCGLDQTPERRSTGMGCHGGGHVLEALSVYLGLGALAFGAATLLPLQSETALVPGLARTPAPYPGGLSTQRYGWWSLLLCWTPVIGDPPPLMP